MCEQIWNEQILCKLKMTSGYALTEIFNKYLCDSGAPFFGEVYTFMQSFI